MFVSTVTNHRGGKNSLTCEDNSSVLCCEPAIALAPLASAAASTPPPIVLYCRHMILAATRRPKAIPAAQPASHPGDHLVGTDFYKQQETCSSQKQDPGGTEPPSGLEWEFAGPGEAERSYSSSWTCNHSMENKGDSSGCWVVVAFF